MAVFSRALDKAAFVGGAAIEQFESDFAAFIQTRYAVGVSSGTDALRFALMAMGIGPGDSVITVPNTFIATAAAITQAGAAVELVDVDPLTCLMDPNRLEDLLRMRFSAGASGPRPRAIVPVHLYGQCVPMEPVRALAARYGLKVLEDAAQAHGACQDEVPAGTLGDAAAFSFYPGKNLGACGEAGIVTTNDEQLAERVLLLRDHGRQSKCSHVIEGYNGRLDAIQAGFLSVKLNHLPAWNEARRRWAAVYDAAFSKLNHIRPVQVRSENTSVFHLYVVHCEERDRMQKFLQERNVASGIHYPIPLHRQEAYRRWNLGEGTFPHAERSCRQVISLPMCPELEAGQIEQVIDAVCAFDVVLCADAGMRRAA